MKLAGERFSRPVRDIRWPRIRPHEVRSDAVADLPLAPRRPGRRLTIVPAISRPMIIGSSSGKRDMPSRKSTSRWFSAQAPTLTTTSPGPATGSGTDSTTSFSRPPNSWNRSAFTWPPGSYAAIGQTIVAPSSRACASTATLIEIAATAASAQALSHPAVQPARSATRPSSGGNDDRSREDDAQRAAGDAADLAARGRLGDERHVDAVPADVRKAHEGDARPDQQPGGQQRETGHAGRC